MMLPFNQLLENFSTPRNPSPNRQSTPPCSVYKTWFWRQFLWPASRFNGAFPCWWQSYQSVSFLLFFVDVLFLSGLFYGETAKRRTFSIVKNFNKIPIRVIRLRRRRSFASDCWINQFWFECKTSTLIMVYFRRSGEFLRRAMEKLERRRCCHQTVFWSLFS